MESAQSKLQGKIREGKFGFASLLVMKDVINTLYYLHSCILGKKIYIKIYIYIYHNKINSTFTVNVDQEISST